MGKVFILDGKGPLSRYRGLAGVAYLGPDAIDDWAAELSLIAENLPHSLVALALAAGLCWWLFPIPDWYLITAAYGSHLIIDMVVGQRGIALLWPLRYHFYFLSLRSRGVGELMVAILCAVLVFFPLLPRTWPEMLPHLYLKATNPATFPQPHHHPHQPRL